MDFACLRIDLICLPKRADAPLRCSGTVPIRSRTSAVSLINDRALGVAKDLLFVFEEPIPNTKQAANETIITVLFGIDFILASDCTATLRTLSAVANPAARKNCLASAEAVGWLITLQYADSLVWDARISTYGGIPPLGC